MSEEIKIGLMLRFAPKIFDVRGNEHATQKEADQANAIYRLEDQLSALLHIERPPATEAPPLRRGGRPDSDPYRRPAVDMICTLVGKGMQRTKAVELAINAYYPHESEGRKKTLRESLRRRSIDG